MHDCYLNNNGNHVGRKKCMMFGGEGRGENSSVMEGYAKS